ncbi:MAG TPA: hypothetical protein VH274_05250 [Mycobacteriales bacterium]|nr:hypothetical protein [Mycobacteriales bacterium]
MPSQITASDPDLAALIEDAKRLQLAMLPRPRTLSPRVIDLTGTEIRIPEATASLLNELDPYGT